jgi:hypothetical protein
MAAGFGGGRDLLRGPAPGVNPVAPGDGERALSDYFAAKPWPRANTDEGVLQIQTMLRTLGYDPGPLDGIRGARTRGAVVAFQRAQGLTPDGVVGPRTREALAKALAAPRAAGTPLLDPAPRRELEEMIGAEAATDIAALFRADAEVRVARGAAALAEGDLAGVAQEFHALKSSAASWARWPCARSCRSALCRCHLLCLGKYA